MKRCSGCHQYLPLEEFWLVRRTSDERQDWCKGCRRAWRHSYREIEREQDRARYARIRKRVMNAISRDIAGDTER